MPQVPRPLFVGGCFFWIDTSPGQHFLILMSGFIFPVRKSKLLMGISPAFEQYVSEVLVAGVVEGEI
ncbi:MAG: hypothetical protein A2184_02485 [Candidatus Moranbacteria bacterium RIFOXYA1_FULL_44_7]|uniref:Uncharacterized protein n=1 Tax=Candidatus Amesbacteria bacterium RIFOXYB1_FULL_44_23 TaxID=1797263 RepID=A0A1F4ZSL2_9BACT|nr:MAG: hypothetical protein A2397_01960 [Candidatus Amesbacteria bacterium RIFOXYB1_FULL_44_23]OGI26899.1 MAG: hypothetical protein A2184_02485 [Candidatus Moranbacteria bacterium RIFOXYA1_FULL_44_7]